MNITAYKPLPDDLPFYYGKASIKEGYFIANADEYFYYLVGKNTCYSLPELLHPDDAASFMEAVKRLDCEPQSLIVRFLVSSDRYRYFYMALSYNGKVLDGFQSFDIEISDIMMLLNRYKFYEDLVGKYRRMLSLQDGLFLEYSYVNDEVQLYEYYNGQSRRMYNSTLIQAEAEIKASTQLTEDQKEEFFRLAEAIQKGMDCFKLSLDAEVFLPSMKGVRLECNCAVTYKEDRHDKVVGIIHYSGDKKPQKTYYRTEYASDSMTGLFNKRAINEYAIEQIQNNKKNGYLAIIDIDNFKQINDRYGHMFGDEVIIKTAEILRSITQNRGMAGRFGGDEFLLVLDKVKQEEEVRRIMKVLDKHAKWAFAEKVGFTISFSVGICKFPEDGDTYEEVLKKADKCLYLAKDKGKNRYIIYRENLHSAYLQEGISKRSIGLKAAISDDKKHVLVAKLLIRMHRYEKDAVEEILEQMQTYFDIDGIAIYAGTDMKCIASSGNYLNPIENMSCVFELEYQKLFDENGCFMESNMMHLEKYSPLAYETNTKMECSKFIQFMGLRDGRPVSLVSFDFFNRTPKFGVTDQGLMQTVGKFLAEIVIDM